MALGRKSWAGALAVLCASGLTLGLPAGIKTAASAEEPVRPAVVQLVADIHVGAASSGNSGPYGFTTFGDHAYFAADDGAKGYELWRTDAIDAELFLDVNPGPGSGGAPESPNVGPGAFTPAGDVLYFAAHDGTHGNELWRTDGASNTSMVSDINEGVMSSGPGNRGTAVLDGELFFNATQTHPDERLTARPRTWNEDELWLTSTGGVTRHNVNPTLESGNFAGSAPLGMTTFKNHVYFSATGSGLINGDGRELWRADRFGFQRVADLAAGYSSSFPGGFTSLGDDLYFTADGDAGQGLWSTNGGAPEFVRSFDRVLEMTEFDGHLYFAGDDDSDESLWRTDGGVTEQFDDGLSEPRGFTRLGADLYFVADDGTHGRELWRTDGTTTELVHDILPGESGAFGASPAENPPELTELEGFLYFNADDGTHGRELWRTNGTVTELVRDLAVGSASSRPMGFARVGRNLVFAADDGELGREVWRVSVPGPGVEGPPGHVSCSDGVDNDEDGLTDESDPDCQGVDPGLLVPHVPHDVTATRGNGKVTVRWRAGSDSGPAPQETQFTVTAAPGGRSVTVPASARLGEIRGLKNGTAYRFTVTATNTNGSSAPSPRSNAVVPAGPPGKVGGVTAESLKSGQARVVWKAPNNNGAALTRYQVVLTANGERALVKTVKATKTKVVVKGLAQKRYTVRVTASSSAGNGKASRKVQVTVR